MLTEAQTGKLVRVPVGRALVHAIQPQDAAKRVCWLARHGAGSFVVTPNISHIAMLESSPDLRAAYDAAALVVPDGWPVAAFMGLRGARGQRRVNGTQLVVDVLRLAAVEGLTVGFIGGSPGVAETLVEVMNQQLPGLAVSFVDPAPIGFDHDPEYPRMLSERLARADVDVLCLGLGTPKQELLASSGALQAGVTLCVGSALDFIAGARRRAPLFMREHGLEWLWRILAEPRRLLPRYCRDLPRFIVAVARHNLFERSVA